MKKLFFTLFFSLFLLPAFCDVFKDSQKMVEDFWVYGNYIKIIKNENNICYLYKNSISAINIDEDDMEISSEGFNIWTGDKNGNSTSFNIKKWDFKSDKSGNIIISRCL